jgi:CRP-like cAMP-binding protein
MATINIFRHDPKAVSFNGGQTIFKEGDPGDLMYVVQSGEVDILLGDTLLETVGEGGVVGEMALVDSTARSATARARTDCRVVPLDETLFKNHIHQTPFFAIQVMRVMADRLRRMNERVA